MNTYMYSMGKLLLLPSFINRIKPGRSTSQQQVVEPPTIHDVNTITQLDGSKTLIHQSKSFNSRNSTNTTTHHQQEDEPIIHLRRRRYRGFSTSISALFLDEQVVCSAVACCGILASRRTEYLLEMRHTRRGVTSQSIFTSSNIVTMAFLVTIFILLLTYLMWGTSSPTNSHTSNKRLLHHKDHFFTSSIGSSFLHIRMYHRYIWYPMITYFTQDTPHSAELYNSTTTRDSTYSYVRALFSDDLTDSSDAHTHFPILLRIFTILLFLGILGIIGRQRRLHVRYDILKTRLHEDQMIQYASTTAMDRELSMLQDLETASQGASSHTLIGCYPMDRKQEEFSSSTHRQEKNTLLYEENISERCYSIISYLCCGCIFHRWIQCLSCCALAQEAREIRLLVPTKLQRIDLITHQPFDEYYKDIYSLRRRWKGLQNHHRATQQGWNTHISALSLLSHGIVVVFAVGVTIVTLSMMFNPIFSFTWGDAFVILFTFGQSFLVLGMTQSFFHYCVFYFPLNKHFYKNTTTTL